MSSNSDKWLRLCFEPKELQLKGTLNGGQSFRWKQIDSEWIGVFNSKLWRIKQYEHGIEFKVYTSNDDEPLVKKQKIIESSCSTDIESIKELRDYFQLDFNLREHYTQWCKADELFNSVANDFYGIRMLKQEVLENIFSFICSSNNHISRISSMVEKLAIFYGKEICSYNGSTYYAFPTIEALNQDGVETKLRVNGFGYRAKYIANTAKIIAEKGGNKWITALQAMPYKEAKSELMTLTGVGAKVADCICLMSLAHMSAIPVDTHVYQIARHYISDMPKQKTVTDKLYQRIGDHFRKLYGPSAGWAQTVLFCADLKKFQARD